MLFISLIILVTKQALLLPDHPSEDVLINIINKKQMPVEYVDCTQTTVRSYLIQRMSHTLIMGYQLSKYYNSLLVSLLLMSCRVRSQYSLKLV